MRGCPTHPRLLACGKCIREMIEGLPEDAWLVDSLAREHQIVLDPDTLQVVLDFLEQRFGIS